MTDFTKDFFQKAWGESGYYEDFAYGVGIDRVCEVALYPFLTVSTRVLEIGPGGGAFTSRIVPCVAHLTALDVIKMPSQFADWKNFTFRELPDQDFSCKGVARESIDFVFSYNVFCHLSNPSIAKYLLSVNRVLVPGGYFVFMLANFAHTKKNMQPEEISNCRRGDMTSIGHFYQDELTLGEVIGEGWSIISSNMISEHRDLIIHLQKM